MSIPDPRDILCVDGLSADVTVLTDSWGVRHVRASNPHDVFFVQGFYAATDRLFQLDWWRRRGLGQVAEVLGPAYLERDRASRLFIYRGDMEAEWLAYGPGAREAVTAFVAGINARIEATYDDPELLPPEFTLLGYAPGRWNPEDVVRLRSHGIFANIEQEVARAVTLHRFGPDIENLRQIREPEVDMAIPDGLDVDCISSDVLTTYRLAMGPVHLLSQDAEVAPEGSNNWVVAPSRSSTGRPILANDPHRAMTVPPLRHLVHLTCPEFDVIGAGEPAMPGVSIGHNGSVAFGLTIFPVDQEDLYVYDLNPDNTEQYRYRDGWMSMTTLTESVGVGAGAVEEVELQFTIHGPVIHVDTQALKAFAVRAAWLQPGMAPYLGSIGYLTASGVDEFREALNRWGAPGSNQVAADTDGHISWTPRALVPIRPNWDGLLPVPGDGRYEWAGFRRSDELPTVVDPPAGWLATANEMNLPLDGSWTPVPISYEWYAGFRAERIRQVLGSDRLHTIDASASLQNDYMSVAAGQILDLLPTAAYDDSDAAWALDILHTWDRRMDADSLGAALFEAWSFGELRQQLYKAAVAAAVPADDRAAAMQAVIPDRPAHRDSVLDICLLRLLSQRSSAELASLAAETLAATVQRLTKELGPTRSAWAHGRMLTSQLPHPLAELIDNPPSWMRLGPVPKSGSFQTVGVATYDPATGIQNGGASFRMVIDVGSWDDSIAISTPGQSGDPRSPHYDDLYATWLKDQYFPLAYSPEAVAKYAEQISLLRPTRPRSG